jgi:hypothetical protein
MAARKVTITLPEGLVAALQHVAAQEGIPLSRLIARAADAELRHLGGLEYVAAWQAEHGAFTAEELAEAKAEMAAADAAIVRRANESRGGASAGAVA